MTNELTNILYLKELLGQEGIRPRRARGQNFLICNKVIETIVQAAHDGPNRVTELGAGLGVVTQALLREGLRVRAIESDKKLGDIIERMTPAVYVAKLKLIIGDLRDESWEWPAKKTDGESPYQIVGNIPYNLSGLIIRQITRLRNAPRQVVLLVQKEVGNRLLSQEPNRQLIGLAIQLWGSGQRLLQVPAGCFWPQPKVDSQLLLLKPNDNELLSRREREQIMEVARPFFETRRKQMGGALRRCWKLSMSQAEKLLDQAGIQSNMRPQELSLVQWVALKKLLI